LVATRVAAFERFLHAPAASAESTAAYADYIEAKHAVHRHDSPHLVALIEPGAWAMAEPTQARPHDAH
jgi:hypothetical protein